MRTPPRSKHFEGKMASDRKLRTRSTDTKPQQKARATSAEARRELVDQGIREDKRGAVVKNAAQKQLSSKGNSGPLRHDDKARASKGRLTVVPTRLNRHDSVRSVLSEIPLDGSIIEGEEYNHRSRLTSCSFHAVPRRY